MHAKPALIAILGLFTTLTIAQGSTDTDNDVANATYPAHSVEARFEKALYWTMCGSKCQTELSNVLGFDYCKTLTDVNLAWKAGTGPGVRCDWYKDGKCDKKSEQRLAINPETWIAEADVRKAFADGFRGFKCGTV
jgi:hypothetical protein